MLDSDKLRVFLAVVRTGSTVAAARRLGIDHSTVSRRLVALEQALDTRLFERSPRGLAPTEAAAGLIGHAERIESELIAAADSVTGLDTDAGGTVRLATPEAFAAHFVAPHVAELHARHPRLMLELAPETRSVSLSKREADIAVTVRRPPRGRLVVRKLADYGLGLFASPAYLACQGPISNLADLQRHRLVSYIDELLDYPEINALDEIVPGAETVFRSSSSAAQHSAIAAGIGIGLLHLMIAGRDPRLIRIMPETVEIRRSYWLVLHADLQKTPRIRAVVDFLDRVIGNERDQL